MTDSSQKPSFPYVEYLVTRNPGTPKAAQESWFFNLESSSGTFDQVQRYEMKGWPIVGYGNLSAAGTIGGIAATDTTADEHQKIKLHIDNQLVMRRKAEQAIRAELEGAERGRDTIEQKVERARKAAATPSAEKAPDGAM